MSLRINQEVLEQLAAQIDVIADSLGDQLQGIGGLVGGVSESEWQDSIGRPLVEEKVQSAQSAYQGVLEALKEASTIARQRAEFARSNGGS